MDYSSVRRVVRQVLEAMEGTITEALMAWMEGILGGKHPVEKEQNLRQAGFTLLAAAASRVLKLADPKIRAALRRVGHANGHGGWCRGRLQSKGVKTTELLSLFGPVKVERWCAQCKDCHRWVGSVEQLLGAVNAMTPACAAVVTEAAVVMAYQPAQGLLERAAGLKVDQNRLHRTVAEAGPQAAEWAEEDPEAVLREIGAPPPGAWIYFEFDGGRLPMRGEGSPWQEPYIGMVMWRGADGHWVKFGIGDPGNRERVTVVMDQWLEMFHRRGRIKVAILGDGAPWIWELANRHPWAIHLLDYYHLKEKVWKAAKAIYGEGTSEAAAWVKEIVEVLWYGQVPEAIEQLQRMSPRGKHAAEKREALRSLTTYLVNHEEQISYAEFSEGGCCVGSGAIESACKQLFSMRMKGPGMFWTEEGAAPVIDLRMAYMTDHWRRLWVPPALRARRRAA